MRIYAKGVIFGFSGGVPGAEWLRDRGHRLGLSAGPVAGILQETVGCGLVV